MWLYAALKTIFSFSGSPEKIVFPKKLRWNMIFLVSSGKVIFLFPQNKILPLGWKMKEDLSKKNRWKYDIFFRCFEKMTFSKRLRWNIIFLVLFGKMVFVFPEARYFFFVRKMKDNFSQEIHGGTVFSVYTSRRYKRGVTPICQKKSKMASMILLQMSI